MRFTHGVLILCLSTALARARVLEGPQRSLQSVASRLAGSYRISTRYFDQIEGLHARKNYNSPVFCVKMTKCVDTISKAVVSFSIYTT